MLACKRNLDDCIRNLLSVSVLTPIASKTFILEDVEDEEENNGPLDCGGLITSFSRKQPGVFDQLSWNERVG